MHFLVDVPVPLKHTFIWFSKADAHSQYCYLGDIFLPELNPTDKSYVNIHYI